MTTPVSAPTSSAPSSSSASSAPSSSGSSSAPSTSSTPSTSTETSTSSVTGDVKVPGTPSESSSEGSAKSEAEKAVQKEIERQFKLKINGKEKVLSEQEVLRRAAIAEAAEERFQTAAAKEKQFQEFLEVLQSSPIEVLQEMGVDFETLATERLAAKVQRDLMDPVERELQELREFKRQQEEARQQQELTEKQKAEKQHFEQVRAKVAQEYDAKISEVLNQSNLPKTPETIKRVAQVLKSKLKYGYEMDIAAAVDMVKESYVKELQALTSNLDGDSLLGLLGDGITNKIRKYDLAKLQAEIAKQDPALAAQISPENAPATPAAPREKPKQFMNREEWEEYTARKAGLK